MKTWRMLTAICMIGAMIFAFAACGSAPAQPTTEPTAETETTSTETTESKPLVDPETFKAFIGTWYADGSSASYRIIIDEDATWSFTDAAQNPIYGGGLMVNEDNVSITLFDPDGVQAMDLKMEENGKFTIDVYLESLMDTLSTNHFLNQITNNSSDSIPVDEDASAEAPAEEPTSETFTEENLEG